MESTTKKPGVYKDFDGKLTQNKFMKRTELESTAFLRDRGLIVVTEGEEEIRVPRWSIDMSDSLGRAISRIVMKLFPNHHLFIDQIATMDDITASEFIYNTLFVDCISELKELIAITMRLDSVEQQENRQKFEQSITIVDFVNIVNAVIEQEIQNPMLIALVKKTFNELETKLQLQT